MGASVRTDMTLITISLPHRWTAEALQKYMKSTRSEAPYLPSNIQYIANNNALDSKEDVSYGCATSAPAAHWAQPSAHCAFIHEQ